MKKTLSFILICALILSMSVFPTFAQNSKIRPELQEVLNTKADYDTIDILLSTTHYGPSILDMPSWPNDAAGKELSEFYRNRYLNEIEPYVFNKIEHETILQAQSVIVVRVRVCDVEKIANNDMVRELSYWEDVRNSNGIDYYFDKLVKQYPHITKSKDLVYEEICEMDVDFDDAIDFCLIYATAGGDPACQLYALDLGDRFFVQPHLYSPFPLGYAVYDLEKGVFEPLSEALFEKYPNAKDFLIAYKIGTAFGDTDNNGEISIMDATYIQLAVAQISDFPADDDLSMYGPQFTYRSDANRDGTRDVLDATAIQLILVSL